MLKFRCQHCGQRIAVPARHLGKLVTCAECGRQTHPLAQEMARAGEVAGPADSPSRAAAPAPAPAVAETARPAAVAFDSCANCGQTLGRLQASHLWESERVCGACYHVLSAESSVPVRPEPVRAMRVRSPRSAVAADPATTPGLREQLVRGLVVFLVGVVALYGALTLLRDLAGLIAVAAVAVLALLALYGIFRARWSGRVAPGGDDSDDALVAVRGE